MLRVDLHSECVCHHRRERLSRRVYIYICHCLVRMSMYTATLIQPSGCPDATANEKTWLYERGTLGHICGFLRAQGCGKRRVSSKSRRGACIRDRYPRENERRVGADLHSKCASRRPHMPQLC